MKFLLSVWRLNSLSKNTQNRNVSKKIYQWKRSFIFFLQAQKLRASAGNMFYCVLLAETFLSELHLSCIYIEGMRTKLFIYLFIYLVSQLCISGETKREQKEWKGFVDKHRDSFLKNICHLGQHQRRSKFLWLVLIQSHLCLSMEKKSSP